MSNGFKFLHLALPILLAAAAPVASVGSKILTPAQIRKIEKKVSNICTVAESPTSARDKRQLVEAMFAPAAQVISQIKFVHGVEIVGSVSESLLQAPVHGKISGPSLEAGGGSMGVSYNVFKYVPDQGFIGEDAVAFDANVNGKRFRIRYTIHVQKSEDYFAACDPSGDRG